MISVNFSLHEIDQFKITIVSCLTKIEFMVALNLKFLYVKCLKWGYSSVG